MNQSERRAFLLRALLSENPQTAALPLPADEEERRRLLRGLMNVRPPKPVSAEFLRVQDAYLAQRALEKGVVHLDDLTPVRDGLYLWQGDITRLAVDAIVNAANSGMTGCYQPNHHCIDNCIHSFGGVQMRLKCDALMRAQGFEEPTGRAKITPAYNLPSRYVLHTVGPIVRGALTARDEALLASCYRACLELAAKNGLKSVAFCCISTGVFRFPPRRAAELAVQTVSQWQYENANKIEVIFNVFSDADLNIYKAVLG